MQHPHRRWEGCRGDPWVSGLPEPERTRGQAPADKAENREQTLKLLLGETRVTWRQLNCLQANALRSMEGLWLQRRRARCTLSTGQRTACAPSEGAAPRHERGQGMRGPPPSRADVRCGGTAGWPTGREPYGHGAAVGVGGRESRPHGADNPRAKGSRLPCKEGVRVGVMPNAFTCLSTGTGEPCASKECAAVRGTESLTQSREVRRETSGPSDSPEGESRRGQEPVGKAGGIRRRVWSRPARPA